MLRVRMNPTINGMRRYIKQSLGMTDKELVHNLIFDFYQALKTMEEKVETSEEEESEKEQDTCKPTT